MSIGPSHTTAPPTPLPEPDSFALRFAKRSFEPYNTNPTPRMFADKWTADPD